MRPKVLARTKGLVVRLLLAAGLALGGELPCLAGLEDIQFAPEALLEGAPLVFKGLQIQRNAAQREARHKAELAARGVAEVPACTSHRYRFNVGGLGDMPFDAWGKFYIDRRFVTAEEMETVHALERWAEKWIFGPAYAKLGAVIGGGQRPTPSTPKTARETASESRPAPRAVAGGAGLPVFCGFEDERYQEHDALIAALVADFNANKAAWCGGSAAQAGKIGDLAPALVKAHMIEESGGNGPTSKAAWAKDPLQVNVPGDWGAEKEKVGLAKPTRRNEGTLRNNVRAAIMYLSRKGFGVSARPAAERPEGFFDGWPDALRRYNGRRDRTDTDRHYSEEYADKIVRRAANPELFVPIEIKLAK